MQLALIGPEQMGATMVRSLMKNGDECVVFDMQAAEVDAMNKDGAIGAGARLP